MADTEILNAKNEEKRRLEEETRQNYEIELKKSYEEGTISEAEFKTMMSVESKHADEKFGGLPPGTNFYDENAFMREEDLIDPAGELTQEDKLYLAMKWGRLYKPNEWVELEKKYVEMTNSFDIQDSDTTGTLILICKTYLKMNQAINQE